MGPWGAWVWHGLFWAGSGAKSSKSWNLRIAWHAGLLFGWPRLGLDVSVVCVELVIHWYESGHHCDAVLLLIHCSQSMSDAHGPGEAHMEVVCTEVPSTQRSISHPVVVAVDALHEDVANALVEVGGVLLPAGELDEMPGEP